MSSSLGGVLCAAADKKEVASELPKSRKCGAASEVTRTLSCCGVGVCGRERRTLIKKRVRLRAYAMATRRCARFMCSSRARGRRGKIRTTCRRGPCDDLPGKRHLLPSNPPPPQPPRPPHRGGGVKGGTRLIREPHYYYYYNIITRRYVIHFFFFFSYER